MGAGQSNPASGTSTQAQILNLQETDMMNSLSKLSGAELTSYINTNKASLENRVIAEHSDTFQKVYNDMIRSSDTANNIMYYYVRNKDLDNLQTAMLTKTTQEADAAAFDNQTAKRQFEVNEWTVGNKQDTLFFLQLLLITFTLMVCMIYLQKLQILPPIVYNSITGVIAFVILITLIVRARYTANYRDKRYWNRRRFAQMGGPPTTGLNCPAIQGTMENIQSTAASFTEEAQNQANSFGSAIQNASSAFSNSFPSSAKK